MQAKGKNHEKIETNLLVMAKPNTKLHVLLKNSSLKYVYLLFLRTFYAKIQYNSAKKVFFSKIFIAMAHVFHTNLVPFPVRELKFNL